MRSNPMLTSVLRRARNCMAIIFIVFLLPLALHAQTTGFKVSSIPDSVFTKMQGKSYPKGCKTNRSELRLLTLLYIDEHGTEKQGEMICNRIIADDLISIFRELHRQRYPIHSIRLIDEYNADDQRSMEANNTSCFNYRLTTNGALSKHARGMAVDINPLWNPCIHITGKHAGMIEPRNAQRTHKIDKNDLCYRLFIQHGFKWGGAWRSLKDYQHFEK